MNDFAYVFLWEGDLHVGVSMPDEKSELSIYASESLDIEIYPSIIESGCAVIPVRFHNKAVGPCTYDIKFEFEG